MRFFYFKIKNNIYKSIEEFDYKINTTLNPCWKELTEEQTEFYLEHPTASIKEIRECQLQPPYIPPVPTIKEIREEAIGEIDKKSRNTIGAVVDVLGFCDAVASTVYAPSRGTASIYSDSETFKTADDFLTISKSCREKVLECAELIDRLNDKNEIESVKQSALEYFDSLLNAEDSLERHKRDKIREIEVYDVSENVNGFFFNNTLLWLDKNTRTGLVNTINSAIIVGREQINIWFSGMYISLLVDEAMQLLAMLEIYATDCYNVTALHKVQVNNLETIEEVDNFDVTADYPERLVFDMSKK